MTAEPQTTYGCSDWRLPSPHTTPKTSNFSSSAGVFQTPKSAGSPSFFIDAFATPRPNGQSTPAQTPVYGTFTVVERPASPRPARPALPEDPEFHHNRYKSGARGLQLPPVSPSRRLSSSPTVGIFPSDPPRSQSAQALIDAQLKTPMDPYQMQTPPPTRGDASSRQKMPPPQTAGVQSTPTSIAPRPAQTPIHATQTPVGSNNMAPPNTLSIQTPYQYNSLQFSPDVFSLPNGGPLSAPVYPQSRLFWDPSSPTNPSAMDMNSSLNDPFGPTSQANVGIPTWPGMDHQSRSSQSFSFHTPATQPQRQNPQSFWSPGDVAPQMSASFSHQTLSASTGVDPNVLMSFSNPTTTPVTVHPEHTQSLRQPYEHQMQISQRELESARKSKHHARTHTPSSASASDDANPGPGLHRSNTDSGFRRKAWPSTDSRLSSVNIEAAIQRRTSPLKRHSQQNQVSLTSIPESSRSRPRTRLVIGDDGRARTETVPADEDDKAHRRSGLWAELDSESDSEAEDLVTSQRSSFILPSDGSRRQKQARIDNSVDLIKVNRSLSSGSLSNLPMGIRRSASSSSRRNQKIDTRRFSAASFGTGALTSDAVERGSEMEGVEEGGAQAALRRVVEDRHKRQEQTTSQDVLRAHNQRWSLASADVAKLQPVPSSQQTFTPSNPSNNASYHSHHISPTALDMNQPTPSTDRTTMSQSIIRCVCNHPVDDGSQMLQCESCLKWLHVRCTGINENQLPPVFVCVFCTGNTPLVRGGRVREPMRMSQHSFTSPLAGRGNNPFSR